MALAELETRGKELVKHGTWACSFEPRNLPASVDDFGSIVKIGEILSDRLMATDSEKIAETIAESLVKFGKRKISFGLSIYGSSAFTRQVDRRLAFNIKKRLQVAVGVPVRYIAAKSGFELNSAQVTHNSLISRGGDFLLVQSGKQLVVARTISVQNIESFAHRDYGRPCRPAKVGMLPPKLAKTMINLADAGSGVGIIDPFCGSGTVLQEALLMGYDTCGSDNSAQMISCSQKNLDWLQREYKVENFFEVGLQDAARFKLGSTIKNYAVVTEGYLGQPFSAAPSTARLATLQSELIRLYLGFLNNLLSQTNLPKSAVMCLPFWRTNSGYNDLKVIDQIEKLGYTVRQFQSVDSSQLRYQRPNQIVGRQVLVLKPNRG